MTFDDWRRLKITLGSVLYLLNFFLSDMIVDHERELFMGAMQDDVVSIISDLNLMLEDYLEFSFSEGEMAIRKGKVEELDKLLDVYENLEELLEQYSSEEYERLKESGEFDS